MAALAQNGDGLRADQAGAADHDDLHCEPPRCYWSAPRVLPFILVAQTVDRVHDLAVGQHGSDLPTDLLDVAVDGAVGDDTLITIHRIHELITRVDATGMRDEHLEELELHRGEVEVPAADRGPMTVVVQ